MAEKKVENAENHGFERIGEVNHFIKEFEPYVKFIPKKFKGNIKIFLDLIKERSVLLYFNNGIISYKIMDE